MGYGVTKLMGEWVNAGDEFPTKEKSVFVVDINDTGNLYEDIINQGVKYNQDAVLFQEQGNRNTIAISTNKCPDSWPGEGEIGITKTIGIPITNEISETDIVSKVGGSPFKFSTHKDAKLHQNHEQKIWGIIKTLYLHKLITMVSLFHNENKNQHIKKTCRRNIYTKTKNNRNRILLRR